MSSAAEQRQAVADLTTLARRDLAAFWALVQGWPADEVRDALMEVLPALGEQYGDAAAALAADYFETAREAAEVQGTFSPVIAEAPDRARWEALSRWGVDPLRVTPKTPQVDDDGDPFDFGPDAEPDYAAALSRVSGGLQRTIADRHRLTIVESSIADPAASGWRRVARAGACDFCKVLADRRSDGENGVYTEASVQFKSHDNCSCMASPSWSPNVTKVIGVPFRYSQKKASWSAERKARENARMRDYIKSNNY